MASDGEEVEEFYDELVSTLAVKSTYVVVMDDFNTKFGCGGKAEERNTGRYDTDERNDRDDRMGVMVGTNKLSAITGFGTKF